MQTCPSITEFLLMVWLALIQQHQLHIKEIVEILNNCPAEYKEKASRIYGLSQALAENGIKTKCPDDISLCALSDLTQSLGLKEALAAYRIDRVQDQSHFKGCLECQKALKALSTKTARYSKKFIKDPAVALTALMVNREQEEEK